MKLPRNGSRQQADFLLKRLCEALLPAISWSINQELVKTSTTPKKGVGPWKDSPFLLEIDARSDGGRLVAELFLNDALAFGALKLPVQQEFFGHLF